MHQAIQSAVQTFRSNPDSPDREIFNRLLESGIERQEATRLIVLLPLAYGRVMLSDNKGVLFSDTYICKGDHGKPDRESRLDTLPLWKEAINFAMNDGEPFFAIAGRSPEISVVNAALQDGIKLEKLNLVLSPPVILWADFGLFTGSDGDANKSQYLWQIWSSFERMLPNDYSRTEKMIAAMAMGTAILVGLIAIGVVGYYAISLWLASH